MNKHLIIGIYVAVITMVVCGVCVVSFTVKTWQNSDKLTKAQVEVYNAQRDNIGKPQVIEQRYFSPSK